MKIVKILMLSITLFAMASCGGDDDASEAAGVFEGRWSLLGAGVIMQIENEEGVVVIETTSMNPMYQMVQNTDKAVIAGNEMHFAGEFNETAYIFDPQTNRIKAGSEVYRPVPDGWMWKDGYDGLPD